MNWLLIHCMIRLGSSSIGNPTDLFREFSDWVAQIDSGKPIPDLEAAEEMVDGTRIELGSLLARTRFAVLYLVKRDPRRIIRYQVDRDSEWEHDAMIRHAFFLDFFRETGFVPRLDYISPAVRLPERITAKTDFVLDNDEFVRLHMWRRSIRFMVLENAGTSVFKWVKMWGRLRLATAIQLLKDLVIKIQVIHASGIVHGDIHPGNVLMANHREVKLIDFELAKFPHEIQTGRIRAPHAHSDCFYGLADMEGYDYSYQDDVFRAMVVGGQLIGGMPWYDYCVSLNSDSFGLYRFKKHGSFFEIPDVFSLADIVGDLSVLATIRRQLGVVMSKVRERSDPHAKPDYAGIVAALDIILSAL